uniref:Elapor1-like galactose binding domain-containing protein n=1 Tax=Ditylenchus dipsaci TaxID=166011 RepID=A0A915DA93_9BILA
MNKFINTLSGLSFCFQVPLLLVLATLVIIISILPNISAKLCDPTDFFYQYSPCDETGQRWRYAVPKSHKLQCDNVPPPIKGLNCSFSCPPGNFLDMEMQKCKTCPPGRYSLGDGVRYEQLEKMPAGFSVENFPDESDQPIQSSNDEEGSDQYETSATRPPEFCSNQVGWIVQNGELRYTPTPCISKLSISLNLVRNGYVEFFYKMPKNSRSLVAILQVRNAHCQSYGDQRNIPVGEEGFRIRRLHIRAGQNLVTWTVAANNRELTTLADIIYVPKIDVFGLAFTPSCSNCPAGTYSQGGAHKCESCQSNTFSHKGASKCERCGALEYSAPKSSRCLRRPTCQNFDFYPVRPKSCQNGSRSITYEKIQPAVCVEGSFGASPTSKSESCGVCNAGMFRNRNGVCEHCQQQDEYSEDGITCKKCASNMVPEHGLFFTNWDVLPSEITTSCEFITSDEGGQSCNVAPSWLAMGTQVQSAQTRSTGVALELNIKLALGLFNPLRMGGSTAKATLDNPLGYISLDIQMDCADPSCQLYFVQEHANSSTTRNHFNMIAALNGTQTRRVLTFMRSGSALAKDVLTDKVTIYSLNITNVGDQSPNTQLIVLPNVWFVHLENL